jgi:Tfp pilus assembly protein FimT
MNRPPNSFGRRKPNAGFTLVELCVGLGIAGALAGQAMPALVKLHQERALRATADALAGDLRLARAEAARLSDSVYFRVSGKGAQACYVVYVGNRNDCDCAGGQAVCTAPGSAVIKAEWLPTQHPMQLRSNAETLQFQHRQGLVTQTGSIEVSLHGGASIRQVIAITGRVRHCYSGIKLAGMPKCA